MQSRVLLKTSAPLHLARAVDLGQNPCLDNRRSASRHLVSAVSDNLGLVNLRLADLVSLHQVQVRAELVDPPKGLRHLRPGGFGSAVKKEESPAPETSKTPFVKEEDSGNTQVSLLGGGKNVFGQTVGSAQVKGESRTETIKIEQCINTISTSRGS